jgi:4-hydroxy-4-methyl-2-oxoglutarate aldolase
VEATSGDGLIIHRTITMAGPGDVLVVDGEGYLDAAFLGELMCASCRAHDLAGPVVDGAVRGRAAVGAMGLPPSPAGSVPPPPQARAGLDRRPRPVVPADDAEGVLERSRERLGAETHPCERVEDGAYLYDVGG